MLHDSLYARGWRQGTLFSAELACHAYVSDDQGTPESQRTAHGDWVLASQDCDLANVPATDNRPTLEIHTVWNLDPPPDWGIRSKKCRLDDTRYVHADEPRCFLSPVVLVQFESSREFALTDDRALAFKTWLGLRYDRPAVPDELVPLARRIAKEVERRRHHASTLPVRDVFMQFDPASSPPRYSLFGVVELESDRETTREWLADVSRQVPVDLGIADMIEAATAEDTSFSLIETSYAADVSQVTWSGPEPDGAT